MKNSKKEIASCVIALSISILCITTSKGQDIVPDVEAVTPSFHRGELGLRFMPTFSSFDLRSSDGGTIDGEVTLGYGFGAKLGFNFGPHVGIQGEIIYNNLSQKYKDHNLDRKINISYINIPVLLSLNTGKSKPVNLNFVVGPQVGFNVGSEIEASGSTASDSSHAILMVKQSDLGIAYGVGLEFALNPRRTVCFDIGFRGVYGFLDISDQSQTTTTDSYYILDRTTVETYSGYIGLTFLF